jgi:TPR repeat protein
MLSVFLLAIFGCATSPDPDLVKLQSQAAALDPVAQRRLGARYDFGHGVKQDYRVAAMWYERAADQGDAIAQNNLGGLYLNGLGVATNVTKAVELFKKSAEKGFDMAQNTLGALYDTGVGVEQNGAEANVWHTRAAEQGNPVAMYNLGINYGKGFGVAQDQTESYKWIYLASIYMEFSHSTRDKSRVNHSLQGLENRLPKDVIAEGRKRAKEWELEIRKARPKMSNSQSLSK